MVLFHTYISQRNRFREDDLENTQTTNDLPVGNFLSSMMAVACEVGVDHGSCGHLLHILLVHQDLKRWGVRLVSLDVEFDTDFDLG